MRRPVIALSAIALALAGCAPADEPPTAGATTSANGATSASGTTSATTDACAKDALATRTKGTLTVGTDKPAYEPWFSGDDPTNGEGYESAVAYAVADQLGFSKKEVTWKVVSFTQATAPGPKTFDVDINQVSITAERKKNLDFSTGYYDVAQSVVTIEGSKAENATTLAGLRKLRLGAAVGTTSYTAAKDTIAPTKQVAVYNTNDDAKAALLNGQVDALVVDLPTGLFMAAVDIEGGKLVGQIPSVGAPEQFGFVLDKGSALTTCVSQAVDALRADGTLSKLEQQWLTSTAGAPELK